MVVFKNQNDLHNVFESDLIQDNVNRLCRGNKAKTDQDDEDYLTQLYDKFQKKEDMDVNH